MHRSIIIDVFPDGSTKIEANGFKGQQCNLATKQIELALVGNDGAIDKKPKPDFYATTGVQNFQRS